MVLLLLSFQENISYSIGEREREGERDKALQN